MFASLKISIPMQVTPQPEKFRQHGQELPTSHGAPVRVRVVRQLGFSWNPKPVPGAAELVAANLSNPDDTLRAVSGSRVAFLIVGLKYDVKVWRKLWPRIVQNAIEACKRSNARLIFFDNVYMYGRVEGAMTEETPFYPD